MERGLLPDGEGDGFNRVTVKLADPDCIEPQRFSIACEIKPIKTAQFGTKSY